MPGQETLSPAVPRRKSGWGEQEQGDICPVLRIAGSFPGSSLVTNLPANAAAAGDTGSIPGQEDPLEDEMANHSSILAWRIPWTVEPSGLQFMGSRRVNHS